MPWQALAAPYELPPKPSSRRGHELQQTRLRLDPYVEKDYIQAMDRLFDSPVPGALDERRFQRHTMQVYKKPRRSKTPKYRLPALRKGMARSLTNLKEGELAAALTRDTPEVLLRREPVPRVKCSRHGGARAGEFCDVLGQVACSECIELANRAHAKRIEEAMTCPDVCSVELVGPKLARVLGGGGGKGKSRGKSISFLLPPLLKVPGRRAEVAIHTDRV